MFSDKVSFPTGDAFIECMDGFEKLCGLPMCAGAIDGTFVRIESPTEFGDAYYCYKKYHAILLFACVDAAGLFTYLRLGEAGSAGDAATFNRSGLGLRIQEYLAMPQGSQPQHIDGMEVMPYLVGDGAFKLTEHLMKCYEVGNPTPAQFNFNYALIRTRRVVECAFGRLKGRFRLLYSTRLRDPVTAVKVSRICCALHNFLERRHPYPQDMQMEPVVPSDINTVNWEPGTMGASGHKRNLLASYMERVLGVEPVTYTHAQLGNLLHGPLGFEG